jgi:hypothetical protein
VLRDVIERANTSDQDRGGLPERDGRTRGRPRPHHTDRALPDDSVDRTGVGAGADGRDQQVSLSDLPAVCCSGPGRLTASLQIQGCASELVCEARGGDGHVRGGEGERQGRARARPGRAGAGVSRGQGRGGVRERGEADRVGAGERRSGGVGGVWGREEELFQGGFARWEDNDLVV